MHVKADWQLQDAKANLSQLVNRALAEGPQRITRHGRGAAVVLSERDYERLIARTRGSLTAFLAHSALGDVEFDVRDRSDIGRDVEF